MHVQILAQVVFPRFSCGIMMCKVCKGFLELLGLTGPCTLIIIIDVVFVLRDKSGS